MKKFIVFFISLFLGGCGTLNNPLNEMSRTELSQVPNQSLCRYLTALAYKYSESGREEAIRRGIRDCSYEEIYCLNIGIKPNTAEYYQCRLKVRDQLNQQIIAQQYIASNNYNTQKLITASRQQYYYYPWQMGIWGEPTTE